MKSSKNQSSVRVIVRIRPFNNKERKSESIIKLNKNTIQLDGKEKFTFDQVYNEKSTQEDLFNDVGKKIVKNTYDGYNSCIFAYGQTGCFEKNTDIMLANGTYKKIQDIAVGDIIMGDDSTPRIVKELFHGHDMMYKIKHKKKIKKYEEFEEYKNSKKFEDYYKENKIIISETRGSETRGSESETRASDCYIVNENHVLVLYYKNKIVELPLLEYIKLPDRVKKKLKCYTSSVCVSYTKNLKMFKKILEQLADSIKIISIYDNYESLILINIGILEKKTNYVNFLHILKNLNYKYHISCSRNIIINLTNCHIRSENLQSENLQSENLQNNLQNNLQSENLQNNLQNKNISIIFNKNYIAQHTKHSFTVEKLNIGEYYGFSINGNRRFIGAGFNVLRNSGKSTSMFGDAIIGPGIIPRICDDLFLNQISETRGETRGEMRSETRGETRSETLDNLQSEQQSEQQSERRNSKVNFKDDLQTRDSQTREDANQDRLIKYQVEFSYFEIYNEEVYDLLNTETGKLKVRQHPTYGPYVENLTQIIVSDSKSIMKLINQGNKERSTAKTLMNNSSSRSHAIVTIYFTQIIYDMSSTKPKKIKEIMSKINLVDLAGSERTELSGAVGENFKEALEINKSLLTLGIVINSLAKSAVSSSKKKGILKKKEPPVIQFRNSTLTWILKESLSGNSKTYMLANISPSSLYYDETYSTLSYAQNAKQIVNNVSVNENQNSKIINILKEEIKLLKDKLRNANSQDMREINDELEERELLMKEKEKTWEEKLKESMQYNERIKQEFSIQQEELKQQLLLEMSGAVFAVEQKKKEEYEIKQNEFEKKKMVETAVETAVELHKYYEATLSEIKDKYEKQQKEIELERKQKLEEEIEKLEKTKNALFIEYTEKLKEIEIERERERQRERDRDRERDDRERERQRERELERERQRERELELEKERQREKERDQERIKEIEKEYELEREKLTSESLTEIELLKKNNNLLKESLNFNQQNLQIQMRQYLNDRMALTNQIQQLQSKLSNIDSSVLDENEKLENKYNILKENCRELDDKLAADTAKLDDINMKYTEILNKNQQLISENQELASKNQELANENQQLASENQQLAENKQELIKDIFIIKSEYKEIQEKLEKDKLEYSNLLLKKEMLHTEIINLKSQLSNSITEIKTQLSSEDLLKIKNGFDEIYENLSNL